MGVHFSPKQKDVYSCYICCTRLQVSDKNFGSFLNNVKSKTRDCNFSSKTDKMIRDQIVWRTNNERAQANIVKLEDPSLEKVVKVCLTHETTEQKMKVFKNSAKSTDEVDAVKKNQCHVLHPKLSRESKQL